MEGGVQLSGPSTQEGDLCGQSPRGHTPQLFLCSHQGRDPEQPSALSYGMGVEARKAGGAGLQSPGDEQV